MAFPPEVAFYTLASNSSAIKVRSRADAPHIRDSTGRKQRLNQNARDAAEQSGGAAGSGALDR
jgi:hypothetical protein